MNINRPFYRAGQIFYTLSVMFFLVGIWTYTFVSTPALNISNTPVLYRITGEYPGIPFTGSNQTRVTAVLVDYQYQVKGEIYTNNQIGMSFSRLTLSPFSQMKWQENIEKNEDISVYYSPAFPTVSVLFKGIDFIMVIILYFSGFSLVYFSKWLHNKYNG